MTSSRKLSLKREALAGIGADELSGVAGGTYTGSPTCVLSCQDPCVTFLCTKNLRCIVN